MNIYKPERLLVFLLVIFVSCSQKTTLEWIPFSWVGDTISGKYVEKAYIYIPVKIEDLASDFTMQLDLGTEQTAFYGKTIDPYLEGSTSLTSKYKISMFDNVTIQMGTVVFKRVNVEYKNDFGNEVTRDSLYSKTPKHIGTIAPDMFYDKILVIDYKSSRFAVADSLPAEYKNLSAEEFELTNGIMKLPFHINGKKCKLMFDTGSSPFPLVTKKDRALEISDPIITDSLSGPFWWGQEITFLGFNINKPIEFGGKILESSRVYYDKENLWDGIYDAYNVWGITGNAYFFDNIVIIDYRNKLFRVK